VPPEAPLTTTEASLPTVKTPPEAPYNGPSKPTTKTPPDGALQRTEPAHHEDTADRATHRNPAPPQRAPNHPARGSRDRSCLARSITGRWEALQQPAPSSGGVR
jgi:hypothetical protein